MKSLSRSELYKLSRAESESAAAPVPASFYLTLCSVATPVSVPEPQSPELRRFRFFFSRRSDGGPAQYWLHFGYFATEQEAKKWLDTLRRVYPAAAIRSLANGAPTEAVPGRNPLTDSQVLNLLNTDAANKRRESPSKPSPAHPSQRRSPSLEDTLDELRDSALRDFDTDDTVSDSGVKHLRVEVQAKARGRKDQRTTRRS
jgi:hypothetical protein